MTKVNYTVTIGRFAILHNGHTHIFTEALKCSEHLIVLVGSANSPRKLRNPFTFPERQQLIQRWAEQAGVSDRITILPLNDHTYKMGRWTKEVQDKVSAIVTSHGWRDKTSVKLIGHSKDNSSFYLSLFPQWNINGEHINVSGFKNISGELLNATDLRDSYFKTGLFGSNDEGKGNFIPGILHPNCPETTMEFLEDFKFGPDAPRVVLRGVDEMAYDYIREEARYIDGWKYGHSYVRDFSYDVTFNTIDAIIVQSGHVLCTGRTTMPGLGLTALPGSFINQNEHFDDGVFRSIKEKTGIKLPDPVIKRYIDGAETKTFSDTHRSDRGRIVTHGYFIELDNQVKLPKVRKGSFWIPYNELDAQRCFEDHWHIVDYFVG